MAPFSKAGQGNSWTWWGGFDAGQTNIVSSVKILFGKKPVYVPRSAYADLANVRKLGIRKLAKGCLIQMAGGDADSSFKATYTVVADRLVKRHVESGEFPEQNHEETTYTNLDPGN